VPLIVVMRRTKLSHVFVEHVPAQLAEGMLYISMPFATGLHLCCCGCGREVVTPLSPTDWRLTFDGETISLHPSIGNWGFPCRSHYWIERNRVRWAPSWSRDQVEETRAADRAAKATYYGGAAISVSPGGNTPKPSPRRWWRRLLRRA
jgi:hypothetical protein